MKSAVRPALFRFARIDDKLRSGAWPNASSLARELEVTPRTIHRDVEFLRDQLHAPIRFNPRKKGYYYSDALYRLPYFPVSEGECVALFLAERLLQQYRGTAFAADISRLFRKVVDMLSEPMTIDLRHLSEAISIRPPTGSLGDAKQFEQLNRAVRQRRQLEITYWTASRDETGSRIVDPYHLVSIDGDWYLIAYCHRRRGVRMFAPARIRRLNETGKDFARPGDFKIDDYLSGSFRAVRGHGPPQRVRLCFTPETARYVRERLWHPS